MDNWTMDYWQERDTYQGNISQILNMQKTSISLRSSVLKSEASCRFAYKLTDWANLNLLKLS